MGDSLPVPRAHDRAAGGAWAQLSVHRTWLGTAGSSGSPTPVAGRGARDWAQPPPPPPELWLLVASLHADPRCRCRFSPLEAVCSPGGTERLTTWRAGLPSSSHRSSRARAHLSLDTCLIVSAGAGLEWTSWKQPRHRPPRTRAEEPEECCPGHYTVYRSPGLGSVKAGGRAASSRKGEGRHTGLRLGEGAENTGRATFTARFRVVFPTVHRNQEAPTGTQASELGGRGSSNPCVLPGLGARRGWRAGGMPAVAEH